MPNKYYLREDRKAVKPEMTMPEESHFGENDGRNTLFDFDGYNKAMTEWYDHLASLPALDVDPDYLKTLRPGWFDGKERYEHTNGIGIWLECSKEDYDTSYPNLRRLTIVAPQEAEKGQEGEVIEPSGNSWQLKWMQERIEYLEEISAQYLCDKNILKSCVQSILEVTTDEKIKELINENLFHLCENMK